MFFAYIGFDSVSTHAEEARHPQRDVPIGIMRVRWSCARCCLCMAVAEWGGLPDMVRYPDIDARAPIAVAFAKKAAEDQSHAAGAAATAG